MEVAFGLEVDQEWGVPIELGNMNLPVQERKTPQSKVIITASSPWARLIGSEALICDHDGLRLTLGDDMYSDGNVSLILVAS